MWSFPSLHTIGTSNGRFLIFPLLHLRRFFTSFTANVRCKGLILIPQFHSKISMVTFFKRCDLGFMVRKSNFATNVAKPVRVINTAPHCSLQSKFPMLILTSTQNLTIENHAHRYLAINTCKYNCTFSLIYTVVDLCYIRYLA